MDNNDEMLRMAEQMHRYKKENIDLRSALMIERMKRAELMIEYRKLL